MRRRLSLSILVVLLLLAPGCSGANESLVLIGGQHVDAAEIDRDPLRVLPSGLIMLSYLDASAMFSSGMGREIEQIINNVLPLGPESNFVPSRDIAKVYGGLYAMQGVDFCVVAQGNFDAAAIGAAADRRAVTTTGVALVKTRYAEYDMYTAGNVGFVVLTSHTVLTGNEICMRRALDRLRYSELERSIPTWMIALTETQGATFAFAGDLTRQAAVDAASQTLPFVTGLQYVRVIGNFQAPGVNFVGTLTYSDPENAQLGAGNLANLQQLTQFMSMLSAWGVNGPPGDMQVATQGSEVQFSVPLDGALIKTLLGLVADWTKPANISG